MAGYSGDGSYRKLIANIYGINKNGIIQKYQEKNIKIRIDESMLQLLFSFIRSGLYYGNSGNPFDRSVYGDFWEKEAHIDDSRSYRLGFGRSDIYPQGNYTKGGGFSVRCEAKSFYKTTMASFL